MKKLILLYLSAQAQSFSKKPIWSEDFFGLRKRELQGWDIYKGPYPTTEHFYTDSIGNLYIKWLSSY